MYSQVNHTSFQASTLNSYTLYEITLSPSWPLCTQYVTQDDFNPSLHDYP